MTERPSDHDDEYRVRRNEVRQPAACHPRSSAHDPPSPGRGLTATMLHVVLGAGPLGLAVARQLAARGDRVRAAVRSGRADLPEGVEVVGADLNVEADTRRACEGAAVVYHCANPPYAKWADLHPPLMDAVIEGAAAAGARLVFGDNLYAFGWTATPLPDAVAATVAWFRDQMAD